MCPYVIESAHFFFFNIYTFVINLKVWVPLLDYRMNGEVLYSRFCKRVNNLSIKKYSMGTSRCGSQGPSMSNPLTF